MFVRKSCYSGPMIDKIIEGSQQKKLLAKKITYSSDKMLWLGDLLHFRESATQQNCNYLDTQFNLD